MKKTIFLFLLATAVESVLSVALNQQDDWVSYKDELYIKAFNELLTYEEAHNFCVSQGNEVSSGSLVLVKDSQLQDFVGNYTLDIVDNVWLGGRYDNASSQFLWEDGEPLAYANWLDSYPRNITDGDGCIELRPLDGKLPTREQGKWAHATCRKRNLVMCQKQMPRTLEDAFNEIIKLRQLLEELDLRVVPVGSIYIEYYGQPSPEELWPKLTWEDVTETYAGLFFRAHGSGSEEWGVTQSECAPRITQMDYDQRPYTGYMGSINMSSNGWSPYGHAGSLAGDAALYNAEGLRYYTEGCEVRPKNQAVRLWKRAV